MKTRGTILALAIAAGLTVQPAAAQLIPSFGRDRAGTSGYQFLKVPVDARAAAMGQTVASNSFDVGALFWNPALAAQVTERSAVGVGYTSYFADITLNYVGIMQQMGGFTLGLSVQSMLSGDMPVTTEFQPFGTGETFQAIDLAAGITVAQQLTDLFSYGVTGRYVHESIAEVSARTVLFDAGIFYRVGSTGAQMAVVIKNFGFDSGVSGQISRLSVEDTSPIVETEFESFAPPTLFLLGISYEAFRTGSDQALTLSAQLNNPNDNAESFNIGAEYTWRRLLSLRAGYRLGVEESTLPSLGLGLALPGTTPAVRFDYAFAALERLGSTHRIGLELRF